MLTCQHPLLQPAVFYSEYPSLKHPCQIQWREDKLPFGAEPSYKCNWFGFETSIPALAFNKIESVLLLFFCHPRHQKTRLDRGRERYRYIRQEGSTVKGERRKIRLVHATRAPWIFKLERP